MTVSFEPPAPFSRVLAESDRPRFGMWLCTGTPVNAEIAAGSGLDWLLIDGEHSTNSLESIQVQLQVVAGYPIVPVVRVPVNDPVVLKQTLDLGAQNILVPMVDTAEQARAAVAGVRYPPRGVRGVGSALARGARWNRTADYLTRAEEFSSLFVQIETAQAVANVSEIAAVDGVDGLFVGPSDLAASMGHLGQQEHPEVVAAVLASIRAIVAAGKPAGVNAFSPETAQRYLDAGASFVLVAADVAILARASEALADRWIGAATATERSSY